MWLQTLLILAAAQCIYGEYLGCFEDKGNRLMADYRMDLSDINNPPKCMKICQQLSYPYAAVENGNQCFCSKDKPSEAMKKSENDCQSSCPNSKQKCGGSWRLAAYSVHPFVIPIEAEGTYIGCYQDSGERLLNNFRIDFHEINNPKRCIHVCTSLGYLYAGTENGNECFCGNNKPSNDKKKGENECRTSCPNSREKCGASWQIAVYRTLVDPNTQTIITDDNLKKTALGCFEDSGARLLSDYRITLNDINSPKKCYYLCQQLRYDYAGVENGDQCFCGNQKPSENKQKRDSECQSSCPHSKEKCGGSWRLYVYSTDYSPPQYETGSGTTYGNP
ncbi:uncharacterized protein [Halyomorpha halys]|uniref:uncharacterized protein n=1 Tax=Halyomorpha halys TaxID=286706 RepID=UPI0006D50668|nr:putative fungistatic metabolite [Halyomorpha halys]